MERGLCFILVTCRHHRETEVDNGNPDFLEGRLRSLGRSGGSPRLFMMLIKGRGQDCVGLGTGWFGALTPCPERRRCFGYTPREAPGTTASLCTAGIFRVGAPAAEGWQSGRAVRRRTRPRSRGVQLDSTGWGTGPGSPRGVPSPARLARDPVFGSENSESGTAAGPAHLRAAVTPDAEPRA